MKYGETQETRESDRVEENVIKWYKLSCWALVTLCSMCPPPPFFQLMVLAQYTDAFTIIAVRIFWLCAFLTMHFIACRKCFRFYFAECSSSSSFHHFHLLGKMPRRLRVDMPTRIVAGLLRPIVILIHIIKDTHTVYRIVFRSHWTTIDYILSLIRLTLTALRVCCV